MTYSYEAQYTDILSRLIYNPLKKRPSRIGNTQSNFVELIRVDLQKEFPLMDIKKIKFSNILHELLWFIHGDTHIKYLVNNDCGIWTDDAFRYYLEKLRKSEFKLQSALNIVQPLIVTKEEFVEKASKGHKVMGQLDRIYGKQWRSFNGKTDQLQNCINTLMKNPDDRRMIVTAHNPTDIEDEIVGLPSCHNMFQFYTVPLSEKERVDIAYERFPDLKMLWREKQLNEYEIPKFKLNIWFNIRSNDFFLGQPYNMASYALLCHIVANIVNMIPSQVVCTAIDCHLYEAHIPAAHEYLQRYQYILEENYIGDTGNETTASDVTYCKAKLIIKRKLKSIDDVKATDIELVDYNPQPYIKAPLLT